MRAFSVFGVALHDLSEDELYARLFDIRGLVITPNPEILLAARRSSEYRALLNRATLSLPDGIAAVFAVAGLYDTQKLIRHPGVDVVPMIASIAEQNNETLIIVGGFVSDHGALRENILSLYPNLQIICIDPGLISEENPKLPNVHFKTIKCAGPSIVIVALGQGRGSVQGKQEVIANQILELTSNVRFAIGVGGAVDVLAGRIRRAPRWFQRFGFEWIWRLWENPWRVMRIFRAVFVFPTLVAWDTLRQGRFLRACWSVFKSLVAHFFAKSV